MSSIYIEIGQCGCQIGTKLNKRLSGTYYSTRIHAPNKVHAIMVDTQPKVLKPFIDNPPKWLDPDNVRYFQYGRGNNWSYGYIHQIPQIINHEIGGFVEGHKQFSHLPVANEGREEGDEERKLTQFQEKVIVNKYIKENKEICAYTLDRVRKQLESTDCPLAINILCSLGGGTGSGLGTKIVQKIYQEFTIDIFAHVVLPNKSGETPLQIYNCALSLASLQQHTTAICPIQNDNMISMFLPKKQQSEIVQSGKIKNDLEIINEQIADMHARLFKINQNSTSPQFYNSMISQCVVSPQQKYVSIFGSAAATNISNKIGSPFDNCFSELCNQLRVYNQDALSLQQIDSIRSRCLMNNLVILNPIKSQQKVMQEHHIKKLRNIINPVSYNSNINYQEIYNGGKKQQQFQNLFLMNHSGILRYLQYVSISGKKKYEAKAYLWHYKYADLPAAFQSLDTVIDQYIYSTHQ